MTPTLEQIDQELERLWATPTVRRRRNTGLYHWNSDRGGYELFIDWYAIWSIIPVEDYKKMGHVELTNYLKNWLELLYQAWYFNNRHAISEVVPAALKHISELLHQLWRRQRRPFYKTLIKTGKLDAKEVKGRIDPLTIYQRYGHLEKNGANRHKTLCVWHDDTNPSLVVYPDGSCYCFACGNGGDVFTFIQQVEQCTFPESVKIAAELG